VENISVRIFVLIGVVFLISACAGYNESANRNYQLYESQRTGQPSLLDDYRPSYLGPIP
jgi:hypothetical protein